MDRRTREAVRYLGYGKHAVDSQTAALIASSFRELEEVADARSVCRIFALERGDGENRLKIGAVETESNSLLRNLAGCREVIVLGATLGPGADMLMKKRMVTSMAEAVVLQACAAAMLEEYCDGRQEELRLEFEKEGKYLRPRFSPGYGDFPVSCQGQVLKMLEAAKKIGLTMTDGGMLVPTKSVTAVIGISREKISCHREGCEACQKTDCLYRRE